MARSILSLLLVVITLTFSADVFAQGVLVSDSRVGVLTIHVTGLRNSQGKLAISVYAKDNSEAFPGTSEKAIQTFYIDARQKSGAVVLRTRALPFGEYAVALMHDENGNGKLDTTVFGIPKEGFGFSKNPRVMFGPPSYDNCAFPLDDVQQEIEVRVKYFL